MLKKACPRKTLLTSQKDPVITKQDSKYEKNTKTDQFLQLTPAGEEDLDDPSVDEATVPLNPSGDGGHVGNGRGHNTKLTASKSNVSNTSNQQKISYSGVIRVSSIKSCFVPK